MAEVRVLVVDDDPSARDLLVAILEDDGYTVHAVPDGTTALRAAETFKPDLALVDNDLPGVNGGDVARRLRQSSDLPIIFVTGADSANDIRDGFKMGADDYIVKPFDPEELSWRVRAVLRRTGHSVTQVWECGDLVVDEGARTVTRAGSPVALTTTEFKMLDVLIRNRTRLVPKGQLLGQVWGYDAADHLLEVHMSSLRRKLEAHGERMIHTIRGAGYALRPGERFKAMSVVPGPRDRAADQRDEAANERDKAGDRRDEAADKRDQASDRRDEASVQRDQASARRGDAGDERHEASFRRDQASDRRHEAAGNRDEPAHRVDT